MGRDDHFITDARMLIAPIERDPAKLQAYYGDIERLIARCTEELYLLALKGGCRQRRAALADIRSSSRPRRSDRDLQRDRSVRRVRSHSVL